jgi:hypothetical protein
LESSESDRKFLAGNFLKIEDNGTGLLTHHLPAGNEGNWIFASGFATGCWLVEADSTSRVKST